MRILAEVVFVFLVIAGCMKRVSPPQSQATSASKDSADVGLFKLTWLYKAQQLQAGLDARAPLSQATFMGTHNSYNAASYQSPVRYLDPNQNLSINHQLRIGVRAIELDVHTFLSSKGWPWEWRSAFVLCHAQENNLGCSPFDNKFVDGLREVTDWLDMTRDNPEVLLIYLESFIEDGHYGQAIQILQEAFGDLIYRPQGNGCQGIPVNVTKQQIIESGKRILLVTDGCKDAEFQQWVFGGVSDKLDGIPTDDQASFAGYPKCKSQKYSTEDYERLMIRFIEDRTVLSNVVGSSPGEVDADKAESFLRCGANIFGFDMLTANDERLKRMIWSWHENEPDDYNGEEDCAKQTEDGRFSDSKCTYPYRFACRKKNGVQWMITRARGPWAEGNKTCEIESRGAFEFSVPYNAQENTRLSEIKAKEAEKDVWLNYADIEKEGNWK